MSLFFQESFMFYANRSERVFREWLYGYYLKVNSKDVATLKYDGLAVGFCGFDSKPYYRAF